MATWVTPSDASQSRSWCSPQVKVENSRLTETRLPSFGLRTQAITVFLCTSSPAQRSTITSNSALPSPVQRPTAVATRGPPALQESAMRARGNNRGCPTRPRASLWDGLTAPMKPGADRRLHHSHIRGLDRQGQVCLRVNNHHIRASPPKEAQLNTPGWPENCSLSEQNPTHPGGVQEFPSRCRPPQRKSREPR